MTFSFHLGRSRFHLSWRSCPRPSQPAAKVHRHYSSRPPVGSRGGEILVAHFIQSCLAAPAKKKNSFLNRFLRYRKDAGASVFDAGLAAALSGGRARPRLGGQRLQAPRQTRVRAGGGRRALGSPSGDVQAREAPQSSPNLLRVSDSQPTGIGPRV